MKVSSNSIFTCSLMVARMGSSAAVSCEPPRLSSQLPDQVMSMFLPVRSDFGRATGVCALCGAFVSMS